MKLWVSCVLCLVLAMPAAAQEAAIVAPSDKLRWVQDVSGLTLATSGIGNFLWMLSVDGVRHPLNGVACVAAATSGTYDCVAPLPAMTAGLHELRLIAIQVEGDVVTESALSEPLTVSMRVVIVVPPRELTIGR